MKVQGSVPYQIILACELTFKEFEVLPYSFFFFLFLVLAREVLHVWCGSSRWNLQGFPEVSEVPTVQLQVSLEPRIFLFVCFGFGLFVWVNSLGLFIFFNRGTGD